MKDNLYLPDKLIQENIINDLIVNINNGKIVSFPTETVYAMSCDANNPEAIDNVYRLKNRDKNKFFTVFVDMNSLNDLITYDEKFEKLIYKELEEGTTIIFNKKNDSILPYISSKTLGIRIPKHNFTRQLLKKIDRPIIATSVNLSGERAICDYHKIVSNFPQISYVVDNNLIEDSKMSEKPSKIISVANDKVEILR